MARHAPPTSAYDAAVFLDAGGLADLAAQVEQLRAADQAAPGHFDLVHAGRVDQKRALDAEPAADLADEKGGAGAALLAREHGALEYLDALLAALDDFDMDAHGVPRPELRHGLFALGLFDLLNERMHVTDSPGSLLPKRDVPQKAASAASGLTWTGQISPRGRADARACGGTAPCVATWRSRRGGRRAECRERASPGTPGGACNAGVPADRP